MTTPSSADELSNLDALTPAELQGLAQARIFFGHHSVGRDILQGVAELAAERPDLKLRLVETSSPQDSAGPGLFHAAVGSNMDPASKREEFAEVLANCAEDLDLALLKFCYVDVNSGTDPDAFVQEYEHILGSLRAAHPNLTLAHTTLPLRASPAGLVPRAKDLVKLLLGKPRSHDHNRARAAVNVTLRSRFDHQALFDLARLEATDSSGKLCSERADATVPCLAPENTSDGGHLSATGRRKAAAAFLVFLARRL